MKTSTSFECKYQIILATLFVFVNASEDSIMANDDVTPSNLLIALIKKEELEKTPLDMNVSQRPHEEEPS
jgi:hypothetical protein